MRYAYQIEGEVRNNIGDVLQGMVAQRFLPDSALVLNRENLKDINTSDLVYFIANGWYIHSYEGFPPPPNVIPLYISVHVANSAFLKNKEVRKHFKEHAPIGCRDYKTLKLFLGWGIPAYYSGCLTTTTLPRDQINTTGEGECLLVDNVDHPVPNEVKEKLEKLLGTTLTRVSHDPPDTSGTLEEYNQSATQTMEMLLQRYCRAKLVITTKIHCALPCMGMGANVMFIHPNPSDPRLNTVTEFIPVLFYEDIMKMDSVIIPDVNREALKEKQDFLIDIIHSGITDSSNPVKTHTKFATLRRKSKFKAVLYRALVKLLLSTGYKRKQLERVYKD